MPQLSKYQQVVDRVIKLIKAGTFQEGEKIPSVRRMSEQMNFSLMTVLQGYQILEARGIIEARPRSGYFARPDHLWDLYRRNYLPQAETFSLKFKASEVCISGTVDSLMDELNRPGVLPLGCGIPDPVFFPSEKLSLYMSRTVRSNPFQTNQYSLSPGDYDLRLQISRALMDSGCTVEPEEILITSGATAGLILCLKAVAGPGDLIAVESPGYFGFYRALEYLGLRAVEVPANPQTGLCLDFFEKILKSSNKIRSLVLCPSVSNPTGATMPDANKQKLIEMAAKAEIAVIEDDTYGETSYDIKRSRSLVSFGTENVLQVGGFGKILAPGYSIGWAIGGKYHADLIKYHRMAYLSTALPAQQAIASFLADGRMSRHLRRLKRAYSENVTLFQKEIADCFGGQCQFSNPTGGHFLWIEMPKGFDSVELSKLTINHKISICPGIVFSAHQHYRNYLRLNCAVPWSEQVKDAIHKIAELSLYILKN